MSSHSQDGYTVSASSELLDHERAVWKAFDTLYGTDGTIWWTSSAGLYAGGDYGGSQVTYHSRGLVAGEWIQMSADIDYVLSAVKLWRPDIACCDDRFPRSVSVLGGYDCEAWKVLVTSAELALPGRGESYELSITSNEERSYNCFRIVIEAVENGAEGYTEVAEIGFYGIAKSVAKPSPHHSDSWFRSPSYSGRTLSDLTTVQNHLQDFNSVCSRETWVLDYARCQANAWREVVVGVTAFPWSQNNDGKECVDSSTFSTGYCNLWHCYVDGCGPAGDSFYGQNNNWLTISEYYFFPSGTYSMTLACDDSCVMYMESVNDGSRKQLTSGVDFTISNGAFYRFVFVLGNGVYDAVAHITSFTPYW